MYSHAKTNPFVMTPRLRDLLTHSMHIFENDIRSEFELIWDSGKLFTRSLQTDKPLCRTAQKSPLSAFNHTRLNKLPSQHELFSEEDELFAENEENETPNSFVDERTFRCVEEFILKQCFIHKRFDSSLFVVLMDHLSRFDAVKQVLSKTETHFLAMLISSVMRKVFVSLSMTRSQIDTISTLFKCILSILCNKNERLAQQIHSNYNSCVRDAWAKSEEKDTFVEECFQRCECFSLALDTALFGQEHVMSCSVRFVFESDTKQFPLFMALCYASSGEEMASFLFSKLREKKAVFSKLVSVTTDGASNMIGKDRGLFSGFCRLLKSTGTLQTHEISSIKSVWCFAHRMNLVTRDLKDAPCMNDVFSFADWITSKRVAVSYRKFLKTRFPETRFLKIPTPSNTRWLFYRDTINATLSQLDKIVLFKNQNEELKNSISHSQSRPL